VGKPDDPALLSKMPFVHGAITNQTQMTSVKQHVFNAVQDGAELLCGGGQLTGDGFDDGLFFAPTIFDNVHPDSRLAQNEGTYA
jgi:acyl-CoA reductase-like NAD-dependent aldehyde dehydrogenase